jgi:hypothetical protein
MLPVFTLPRVALAGYRRDRELHMLMLSVRNPSHVGFALTLATIAAVLAAWAPVARGDWSVPQVVGSAPPLHLGRGSVSALGGRVAVDSRGDVAVAWSRTGERPTKWQGRRCSWGPGKPSPTRLGCYPVTTVHLTVKMASGKMVTRTVTSAPGVELIGLVLRPAEATVLLEYLKPGMNSPGGVRAAYGPLTGRWSAARTIGGSWSIGYTNGFPWAQPHLALAPDGTVLVAWNGCLSQHACGGVIGGGGGYAEQQVVVACHSPGRPFGAATVVRAAPLGAVPQFDAAGTAYLSSSCSGTVAIAPAHSRRFRATIVTKGATQSFTLALSGAGQGLGTWVAGACSYNQASGNQGGAVLVSILRAGGFVTPFALTSAPAEWADAVASPIGVSVSWYDGTSFMVQVDANGVPGTVQDGPTALPLGVDGGGDVLFAPVVQLGFGDFVRPAGGGADQPGPAPWGQGTWALSAAGRVVAVLWYPDMTKLDLSTWRP